MCSSFNYQVWTICVITCARIRFLSYGTPLRKSHKKESRKEGVGFIETFRVGSVVHTSLKYMFAYYQWHITKMHIANLQPIVLMQNPFRFKIGIHKRYLCQTEVVGYFFVLGFSFKFDLIVSLVQAMAA